MTCYRWNSTVLPGKLFFLNLCPVYICPHRDKSPEKVPIQEIPRRIKRLFFWRVPKLSPSNLAFFHICITSVEINSGGSRGTYWKLCWRKIHNTHESRQNCQRMVSKGSKFCSKVRHLKEFELGAGRGRLTSPCRWLCWWQGKAATPAQRNPLLMHQQSMYNVHTLYTVHTYRGPWQCASSSCIYGIIFLAKPCAQSLIFLTLWLNLHQPTPTCFSA